MKNRGNYLLAAVFLAGLLGLWGADRARVPTRADRDRIAGRVLPTLADARPDDLRRVEIDGGPARVVLERREPGRWQIVEPIHAAADPTKVETLAFNLKSLAFRPESAPLATADFGSYGLAPPERTVRLWGESTAEPLATLEVGRISLSQRFVRAGGADSVAAVDAAALGLVDIAVPAWRDREVFRVPSFEVDAVTIRETGRERALKLKRDRDAWRVVEPVRALADTAKLDGLAADLASLRVVDDSRFVADDVPTADLGRYGLDQPALTLTVEAGQGPQRRRTPQVLHVGKPVPGSPERVYARRDDQDDVLALDARAFQSIHADPTNYRDSRVADIDPRRATGFEVETGGRTFALGRVGNDWAITTPEPARADVPAVAAFFKALQDLRTSTFLPPASVPNAGLDKPEVTIRVWQDPPPGEATGSASSEGKSGPRLVLQLGRRDAGRRSVYARTGDDPGSVLALPEVQADALPRNSLAFRSRLVLAVAPDQIQKVAFEAEGGRTTVIAAPFFAVGGPGSARPAWWLTAPITAPADMDSVERLLKLLGGLRAGRLVDDRNDNPARWGFDQPLLRVTCSRPPASPGAKQPPPGLGPLKVPADSLTLVIGKAEPGNPGIHFAAVEGESLVFTVGGEVLSILDSEWRDRRIATFDADRARRVRAAWPDRAIDFVASTSSADPAPAWGFAGPVDAADLDPLQVKPLVSALAGLKTSRFVQYRGPIGPASGLNPPRARLQVELADGSTPITLRLGNPGEPGTIQATTAAGDDGPIFLVPESVFGSWAKTPRRQGDLPDDVFAP